MIVVFGSLIADLLFRVDTLPRPGETALGESYLVAAGGKGANQAVAAARDGARVAMFGAIGRDAFAEPVLSGLRNSGVDISGVLGLPAPTGGTPGGAGRQRAHRARVLPAEGQPPARQPAGAGDR